jgi:hypothetical protein
MPVGTSGGRTFVEPIPLPSTDPIDFRLPATALKIGFDLLASRTRRRQDTKARSSRIQEGSRAEKWELFAICKLFFFPHFHSYQCNLWITTDAVGSDPMHLRMPSFDRGVTSFLWGFGFGLYLWLGMLSIGVSGATAFIVSAVAAGAIFLFVRLKGDEEVRRPSPAQTKQR